MQKYRHVNVFFLYDFVFNATVFHICPHKYHYTNIHKYYFSFIIHQDEASDVFFTPVGILT
jgi:hypothetical protein